MTFAQQFLSMYDDCKQTRSAEQCRQMVMDAAPGLIRTYLTGYDTCLKAFSQERCRNWFAPAKDRAGVPLWAFLAGVGLTFLVCRKC